MLLIAAGTLGPKDAIPYWVVVACYVTIGLGTLFGGWRIVKTMGTRITKLRPVGGFCAETAGGITLLIATALGIPVSTTHTITGAIIGVGAMEYPAEYQGADRRHARPPRAQQGDDADVDLRPPHHPGRGVGRVPRAHRRDAARRP